MHLDSIGAGGECEAVGRALNENVATVEVTLRCHIEMACIAVR